MPAIDTNTDLTYICMVSVRRGRWSAEIGSLWYSCQFNQVEVRRGSESLRIQCLAPPIAMNSGGFLLACCVPMHVSYYLLGTA